MLRVFRIARLVRVVRLFRVFKELVMLVRTLGEALRAVFWMALLCSVVVFVGGVLCTMVMGGEHQARNDPADGGNEGAAAETATLTDDDIAALVVREYFGTLSLSIFSHFVLITTENWVDMATAVMQRHGAVWGFCAREYSRVQKVFRCRAASGRVGLA